MKILFDPVIYKKGLLNAFKENNMNGEGKGQEVPPKAFRLVTEGFIRCTEVAERLKERSAKLVSLYTGLSEPQKEKVEKTKVDSVVLVHALRDTEDELRRNLDEISNDLDKLEKAW